GSGPLRLAIFPAIPPTQSKTAPMALFIPSHRPLMIALPAFHRSLPRSPSARTIRPGRSRTNPSTAVIPFFTPFLMPFHAETTAFLSPFHALRTKPLIEDVTEVTVLLIPFQIEDAVLDSHSQIPETKLEICCHVVVNTTLIPVSRLEKNVLMPSQIVEAVEEIQSHVSDRNWTMYSQLSTINTTI